MEVFVVFTSSQCINLVGVFTTIEDAETEAQNYYDGYVVKETLRGSNAKRLLG